MAGNRSAQNAAARCEPPTASASSAIRSVGERSIQWAATNNKTPAASMIPPSARPIRIGARVPRRGALAASNSRMRAACSGLTRAAWVQRSSEDSSSICIDLLRVRFAGAGSAGQFNGFGFRAPQVELTGAERWDGVYRVYVFALGNPESRQSGFRETL